MMMDSGMSFRDLTAVFPAGKDRTRIVLNKLNATFFPGEVTLISGIIGSGKTTLLNIISGLLRPTSGEVIVNGMAVSRWIGFHKVRWRRQVGIIFQYHQLLYDYTALENIMLPLIPLGYTLKDCRRKCFEILEKVGLSHHAGSLINTLSAGERQKINIARALVNQPRFILADEPTAHQDPENAAGIFNLLSDYAQSNTFVIIATHEPNLPDIPGKYTGYLLDNGSLILTRL